MSDNNSGKSARCIKHPNLLGCMMAYDDLPKAIRTELGAMSANFCPACIKQALNSGGERWLLDEIHKLDARNIKRHRDLYTRGV